MKRSRCRCTRSTTVVLAALFFCMTIILGSPVGSKAAESSPQAQPKASKGERTEARIKDLHDKLKITEAQEEPWNKVAQVMRDNASTMEALMQARKEKGTMNAVDDLKSYAKIMDAHVAGLNNFIAAFEPLYASMSDEQKKAADAIFTKHAHKKGKKK